MVACNLCKELYHNNYIGLESPFTYVIPSFICGQSINRHNSGFTPFIHLSINDFYSGKAKTVELIFTNYLSLSDEVKCRLQYNKFLSPHRENCNTKSISSLDILTNKGTFNQYLNSYISASVNLLFALCCIICLKMIRFQITTFTMLKTNYIVRAVALIVSRNVIENVLLRKCHGTNFRKGNAKRLSRERNG